MGDTGFEPVTSSVSGKRATAAPIALKGQILLRGSVEVDTGFEPVWTALQAAASPLGQSTVRGFPHLLSAVRQDHTRADDEIRTRDPNLGKVMRYHCATSACILSNALTTLVAPRSFGKTTRMDSRDSTFRYS